jgi:antitoxin (DNA-binding transcriptional repressor) of toxin-antitoxin stability system
VPEITARDRLSAILDAVEGGATFVISRRGRPIARLKGSKVATAADFLRVVSEHPVDEEWAGEARELRASMRIEPTK